MPTYRSTYVHKAGFFDNGAGYEGITDWHLLTDQFANTDPFDVAIWSPSLNPDLDVIVLIQAFLENNLHREFHYRFIPVPDRLYLNNPPIGVNIPFNLWNTFPTPDLSTDATVAGTGAASVTSDFTAGVNMRDFQWGVFNIQIQAGSNIIDVILNGIFSQGDFDLPITGTIVLDLRMFPEEPVDEQWEWTTGVMVAWDSTEQRVRYSPAPKRIVKVVYDGLDENAIRELRHELRQSALSQALLPHYHLAGLTTQVSPPSSNRIYFDPSKTNLRTGDTIHVTPNDEETVAVIQTISSMEVDGCTIDGQLSKEVGIGWAVCPAHGLFLNDPTLDIDIVTGSMSLTGEIINRTRIVTREGASVTLDTFNGIPVLNRRIIAGVEEHQLLKFEERNHPYGKRERSKIWDLPKIAVSASFQVKMTQNFSDYDKATLFFDTIAGRHKPFYMASKTKDLLLAELPNNGSSTIVLDKARYANLYFEDVIYKQLEVAYADGTHQWFNVIGASISPGDTSTLTLDDVLPGNVDVNPITRISYLYRVRLSTDQVTVQYKNNRAKFSFAVMGTRQ